MAFHFIYIIIFSLNVIGIISHNNTFSYRFIKKYFSQKNYNKIIEQYDTNIKIIENGIVNKEILINSSYIFNIYKCEFSFSAQFLYLNETNLNKIYNQDKYSDKYWILLINSNDLLNEYILNYSYILKQLTKAIIVPKNIIKNIDIIAKTSYLELSIYLIEVEEDIFNELIQFFINKDSNINNNYYVKIMTKRYELFSCLNLITKEYVVIILLFIMTILYWNLKRSIKRENNIIYLNPYKIIYDILTVKLSIFTLLFIELFNFDDLKGFYNYKNSMFYYFGEFLIVFSKYKITVQMIIASIGTLLHIRLPKFYITIISYLCLISQFIYIFDYFSFPLEESIIFLALHILISFVVLFLILRNIVYLFIIYLKVNKYKKYQIYGKTLKYKLFILTTQFISFVFFSYYFFSFIQYLVFKKNLYFKIEKYIILESLEILLLIIISVLYIPSKIIFGFSHYIYTRNINNHKIQIGHNYKSNIPKISLFSYQGVKRFIIAKKNRPFLILSPKAFIHPNKKIKDKNAISKKSQIGILMVNA